MSDRRFLTFAGTDVAPILRRADGHALVVFLDRFGRPTTRTAEAWPHELRGRGWHLADIKRFIGQLPTDTPPAANAGAAREPDAPNASGGFLSAHHALPPGDR